MKNLRSILTVILTFIMVLGTFCLTAAADDSVADVNTWYGDLVKVDVTAGTEGYVYMPLFRKYAHGYEFSGHFMGDGEGPQTFVLIDTVKHDGTTWTPSGIYTHGESNYEVVYCCDVETMISDGVYYKRLNLSDSEYYDDDAAERLRAVVTNAYPYVSLEQMKANLKENGYEHADKLTRNEIIAAVQTAIWACSNGEVLRYAKSYKVADNLQWGYPMYDTSNETGLDVKGKRVFKTYEEVGVRIDSLVDYLLAQKTVRADQSKAVITKLDIIDTIPVMAKDGVYTVLFNVELNASGSEGDNLKIDIFADGEPITSTEVVSGSNTYSFSIEAKENSTIKAVLSGEQYLNTDVYFYAPRPQDVDGDGIATSREVSQNLIGVAGSLTPVFAQSEFTVPGEDPVTSDITVNKIDTNGNKLDGATFELFVKGENGDVFVNSYAAENGVLTIEALLPGTYTLVETVAPQGYSLAEDKLEFVIDENGVLTVTENSYVSINENGEVDFTNFAETEVKVNKLWVEPGKAGSFVRPEGITVNLLKNGEVFDTVILSEENAWAHVWTALNGIHTWTVEEVDIPEGYRSEINVDGSSFIITNHQIVTSDITINKIDINGNKLDGAKFELFAKGETENTSIGIFEAEDGVLTIEDLLVVEYVLVETVAPQGYSLAEDKLEFVIEENGTVTITENTFVKLNDKDEVDFTNFAETELKVNKIWVDATEEGAIARPTEITVNLLRDGEVFDSVVLSEENDWTYLWTNLNSLYSWTVEEAVIPDGYHSVISNVGTSFIITNYELVIIPEEDPPLSPSTGDSFTGWALTFATSGIGCLCILKRKKGLSD